MMKVLIVDDTATDRKILERIVADAGHQVILAEDGDSAIRIAREMKPDIIFMDIVMKDKDGFRSTRELKKQPETAGIPVCMVSTKSRESDIDWAKDNGAADYIVKPAQKDQVLQVIQRAVA